MAHPPAPWLRKEDRVRCRVPCRQSEKETHKQQRPGRGPAGFASKAPMKRFPSLHHPPPPTETASHASLAIFFLKILHIHGKRKTPKYAVTHPFYLPERGPPAPPCRHHRGMVSKPGVFFLFCTPLPRRRASNPRSVEHEGREVPLHVIPWRT